MIEYVSDLYETWSPGEYFAATAVIFYFGACAFIVLKIGGVLDDWEQRVSERRTNLDERLADKEPGE